MRKPSYLSSNTHPARLNGRSLVSGFIGRTAAASTPVRGAPSRASSSRIARAGSRFPAVTGFDVLEPGFKVGKSSEDVKSPLRTNVRNRGDRILINTLHHRD